VSNAQSTIPAGVDGPEAAVPDALRGNVRDRDVLRPLHAGSDDLVLCDCRLETSACWSAGGKSRLIIWLNFFFSDPINPCNLLGEDGGDAGLASATERVVDAQWQEHRQRPAHDSVSRCDDTCAPLAPLDIVRLCIIVPDSLGLECRTRAVEWSTAHGGFDNVLHAPSNSYTKPPTDSE